jgi:3-hydroxyisobutyrate dehydrogenase-like beta-hydroxyacid dehydrogenase
MRIGFLGIGNMGLPMAGRLIDAGHEVWICDIREEALRPLLERQARRADTPKALADACDTVVLSLPTLDVFRAAVTGAEGLLAGGALKTIVNTCTVGGTFLSEMERACNPRGVTIVDAPISGGPAGARAGTLAVMVSGDPAKVDALMPVFKAIGSKVVVAGDRPGAAQVIKLTNNIIFATCLVATSEAMALATRGGIAPETMLDVLNSATGRNFATLQVFPNNVVPGTFDFGATFDVLMKDIDLAIEEGEALGVPMWVSQAARLVVKHAIFQGRGQHDLARIAEVVTDGTRKA